MLSSPAADVDDAHVSYPDRMQQRRTTVSITCGASTGVVAEGPHAFGVSAGPLLDVSTITGPATTTRDVRCTDAVRVDPDSLRELTPEEIAYWDTEEMDAGGVVPMDAHVALVDGGLDGGNTRIHTEPDTHTNWGVARRGRASSSVAAIVLCLVLGGSR